MYWYEIIGMIGATLIFTTSYVFDEIRHIAAKINKHLGILVACSMCIGFWVGFIFCCLFKKHLPIIERFLIGCSISILAYVTDTIIILLERLTSVLLQKNSIIRAAQNNTEQQQNNDQ